MLSNYFKTSWRHLFKNKALSFIHIAGLSIGMAVVLLIGRWIWDELSFDTGTPHYDRIAQVMENQNYSGKINTGKGIPLPLGPELRLRYGSDFRYVVTSSWNFSSLIAQGEQKIVAKGYYMEQQAPELLSLHMLRGSRSAFRETGTILLSSSLARNLFGGADPLGKPVRMNAEMNKLVAGVYEDFPTNSSFHDLQYMVSLKDLHSWVDGHENDWNDQSFQLFVELEDHAEMAAISAKIQDARLARVSKEDRRYQGRLFLQPMAQWHLYSEFSNGVNTGGAIQYVWMFAWTGLFVLLLACINFMNLSTARAEKRAREVGIRKVAGSLRGQIVGQFFSESVLVAGVSLLFALLIAYLLLPFFNIVSGKELSLPWSNGYFWLIALGSTLFIGMLAGSYPAIYLSSFRPASVLKGTFRTGPLAGKARQVLVVIQFSVSILLVIGTLVVYRQLQVSRNRPVGYDRGGLITLVMQTLNFHNHFEALRQDLLHSGAVAEVAESNSPVTENDHYDNGFSWPGRDPNEPEQFNLIGVTPEYGKAVGIQLLSGRDFSRQFATDSSALILNEAAVKYMGLQHPISSTLIWYGRPFHVVGVARDMIMGSPYAPVEQAIYYLNHDIGGILNIRLSPTLGVRDALAKIGAVCARYSPEEPFDYQFVDQAYADKFALEDHIEKLAAFFAALAIFISCLGLFGMAAYVAERRTKEIGVRKVLGASVPQVWRLLSIHFLILVAISFAVASPAAYYFMHRWLLQYSLRASLSWWIFAAAGGGALLITLATVSFQTLRAAMTNPVRSLRTE
jgi:hypothetical protein